MTSVENHIAQPSLVDNPLSNVICHALDHPGPEDMEE